jgi:gamma-glutamyltranspeptidase/glutathione hydrolase
LLSEPRTATARDGRDGSAGTRGALSAGSPLAAQAGLDAFARGGNAVDAVLAAALAQTVVEFPWCGVGGDAFLLIQAPGGARPVALNGSGASPAALRDLTGIVGDRVPRFGAASVAVPGFPAAWCLAADAYARLSRPALASAAVQFADTGFELDHGLASTLHRLQASGGQAGNVFDCWPGLMNSRAGEIFRQPELAATLASLAADGPGMFAEGPAARRIVDHVKARGGVLAGSDLAAHDAAFVEPLLIRYRDHTIAANPPVSMGVSLLQELRLVERFDLSGMSPGSSQLIDLLVRCKLAAFEDARQLRDDGSADETAEWMLSDARLEHWHSQLLQAMGPDGLSSTAATGGALPGGTDTTTVAAMDADGYTAVLIQSLFNEFGSREIVPGTGVLLNDRLASQVFVGPDRSALLPGRRPMHTLNAYAVLGNGAGPDSRVTVAGATPGGRGQVQTNLQVLTGLLDLGLSAQEAVDHPRWLSGTPRTARADNRLYVEPGITRAEQFELGRLGHDVEEGVPSDEAADDLFGAATVVTRSPSGAIAAVADPRRRVTAVAR